MNDIAASRLVKTVKQISDSVTTVYEAIEKTVVGCYTKIEDKFVGHYLTRDGETTKEAKRRLKGK